MQNMSQTKGGKIPPGSNRKKMTIILPEKTPEDIALINFINKLIKTKSFNTWAVHALKLQFQYLTMANLDDAETISSLALKAVPTKSETKVNQTSDFEPNEIAISEALETEEQTIATAPEIEAQAISEDILDDSIKPSSTNDFSKYMNIFRQEET